MVNDMSNYLKHIFRKALYLWPCLCVMLAASCMEEEQCDTCSKYPVKVQLNITAEEESSLNTRDTEVGKTHEYINTLCVLLVKDGKVVKNLLPDLSATSAKTGDLKNYVSAPFELVPGTYTVYAFANMFDEYLADWTNISSLADGADVSADYFSNMVLTNPADKLNFSTYFIPMSAKQVVTVDASTRSISIGLDRLVSKIRINVTPTDVKVNSLTFGGCANGVKLFADGGAASSIAYDVKKTMNFTNPQSTVADFYVNATEESGHPFSVELTTNEYSGTTYNATTKRGILPRNSIFPLTLQLNQYGLDLEAQCWVSPIGSLPVEVKVGFQQDTYEVDVPEGCQFAFTVNVKKTGSGNVTNVSSEWTIPENLTGIAFDGASSGVQTVKGHITAAAGRNFELSAKVTWTDDAESTYNRLYKVILHTKDLTEFPLPTTGKQNSSSRIQYLSPEMLNLFIK